MPAVQLDNTLLERIMHTIERTIELTEKGELLRQAFEYSPIGHALAAPDGRLLTTNGALCRILGYSERELLKKTLQDLTHPDDLDAETSLVRQVLQGETDSCEMVSRYRHKDGQFIWVQLNVSLVQNDAGQPPFFNIHVQNITEQKQANKERQRLHEQLVQARKMETVGQLAGGVAHDYNNMLSVIIGYSELALERTPAGNPLRGNLKEILKAARRSSDITQQLLAFARKQTIKPKVLDLNHTVEGILKMLRRLIGEDIDLAWQPGAALWHVRMDPSQVDQILANLCVNARDAIAGVGKITIETGNTSFDRTYCADHLGFIPGDFALLAVSDNGCGMDRKTRSHIFEPFFTTKEIGKGTGMGLATVYGIIKQNKGFINVYSEPGKGTTFRIYLPRHKGHITTAPAELPEALVPGRGETILLVEDEQAIRKMSSLMMKNLGYKVLSASTPNRAIQLVGKHRGHIDLLVTDVIMPRMNGRELSGQLRRLCPDLKVLFISGYTADVIVHMGVLDEGVHFLQKPFAQKDLATRIRKALDRE